MPAASESFVGAKLLTVIPKNIARATNVIQGLYVLFDFERGQPLATFDAAELTARRTAAVSALASSRLSRPPSTRLLLIGSGHLIAYLAEAHCAVRPITEVKVWARTTANAQAAAARIQGRIPHLEIQVADDLAGAARRADIVCAATRTATPLIKGAWLRPGSHIDLVGGYRPDMREIDDEGVRRSKIYVDTRSGVLSEAGDLMEPIARSVISPTDILGEITDLAASTGRTADDEVTLFKSVGWAGADLAAACAAWRRHDRPKPPR
jgi:ornithine cyclodeaminase